MAMAKEAMTGGAAEATEGAICVRTRVGAGAQFCLEDGDDTEGPHNSEIRPRECVAG